MEGLWVVARRASLVAQLVKNPPAMRETRVWSLSWEDPLEKEMTTHSSQYSCLENSHGQRSLAGYSPWGCKESDTMEWLSMHRRDQIYQHSSREELRNALFQVGVCSHLCIMAHRVMLSVNNNTHAAVFSRVHDVCTSVLLVISGFCHLNNLISLFFFLVQSIFEFKILEVFSCLFFFFLINHAP